MQAKIRSIEQQLNDKSTKSSDPSTRVLALPKATGDSMDSSTVTKKLEEELNKRDALIEVLNLYVFFYWTAKFYLILWTCECGF